MKHEMEKRCRHYLALLERDDGEDALHSLMELPIDALPVLRQLYLPESSDIRKKAIVHSISQHRDINSIGFLISVLVNEDDEEIWQESLDGLIALAASEQLSSVLVNSPKKAASIKEAIQLIVSRCA